MKQLILLILICFNVLHAKSITLSNEDLKTIKSSKNEKAITIRLVKYLELKKRSKKIR